MLTTAAEPRPGTPGAVPPEAPADAERGPRVTLPLRRTVPGEGPTRGGRATVRTACLLLISAVAAMHLLQVAQVVLLPLAITVLLNLVFGPLVRRLAKYKVPPAVGAGLAVAGLLAFLGGAVVVLATPLSVWAERIPALLEALRSALQDGAGAGLGGAMDTLHATRERFAELLGGDTMAIPVQVDSTGTATDWLSSGSSVLGQAVVVLCLTFLMLASGDRFRARLRALSEHWRLQVPVEDMMDAVEDQVSAYVLTITAINIGLAVVVGVAMSLLDLPRPWLLGAAAGFLNFVPYLGPMLTASIVALVGFDSWGSLSGLLVPTLAYLACNGLEAFLVTPALLGRRLQLSPVAVLVSFILWTWMWGFGGALIAIPLLLVAYAVADQIDGLRPIALLLRR
ncbi:MAG: AI-2E family transporter [Myxococcales bacterium]|nr:AI-2E family transporter [Myxococcales bacterium]